MPRNSKKNGWEKFAYGSVIEALTQDLYPDKKHVIRELVQNCYDGLADLKLKHPAEPIKPVSIKIDGSSIFVNDTGIGMTAQKMREYRYLGFSTKRKDTDAGFRGKKASPTRGRIFFVSSIEKRILLSFWKQASLLAKRQQVD